MLTSYGTAFADTLRDPAAMAQRLVGQRLPHALIWQALVAVIALTIVLMHAELTLINFRGLENDLAARPLIDAMLMGAITVVMVFTVYLTGRAMGGQGSFGDTLLLITWLQGIVLGLLVLQILTSLILPGLSSAVLLAGLFLQLWVLVHFINVLHGFDSLLKSFGLLMLGCFGVAFGLVALLMVIRGLTPGGV